MGAALRHLRVVWRAEGGQLVAYLRGELDAAASPEIHAVRAVTEEEPGLVVDLSDVHFIDVAGLRFLEALQIHRAVRFRSPSTSLQRLVDLVGTSLRFPSLTA